jgi:hypothetical protein
MSQAHLVEIVISKTILIVYGAKATFYTKEAKFYKKLHTTVLPKPIIALLVYLFFQ